MVHILDSLTRLEARFDDFATSTSGASVSGSSNKAALPKSLCLQPPSESESWQTTASQDPVSTPVERHHYLTVPHRVILWPSVHAHLVNSGFQNVSNLRHIRDMGTPWFVRLELEKHPTLLSCGPGLPSVVLKSTSLDQTQAARCAFPTVTMQHVQEYTEAYFHTFNNLYPILDYDSFSNDILKHVLWEGYTDGDARGVLALMVFALGKAAIEGTYGHSISVQNGKSSGTRGGTLAEPPGIEIFNEARRRLGFVATKCTLENVQILLLQATYYEANSRHVDFWHSLVAASMACQVFVKCHDTDWSSRAGDLTTRAYWACVLGEDLYHLDLDMPQTGIHLLQDEVPLPRFCAGTALSQPDLEKPPYYQYHFLALITLRRLIVSANVAVHECKSPNHHIVPTDMSLQFDSIFGSSRVP